MMWLLVQFSPWLTIILHYSYNPNTKCFLALGFANNVLLIAAPETLASSPQTTGQLLADWLVLLPVQKKLLVWAHTK